MSEQSERGTKLGFSIAHLVCDEDEYEAAMTEIAGLLARARAPGSLEDERLEFLSVLVEAYEAEHVPTLPRASPQAVVDFMLEQKGMTRADLAPHRGGRGRVSDFFTGRRANLSTNQIRALHSVLGLPADLLLGLE